ncbi:glycosyltransferase [Opitutus terrae]|uniref:Glycosyl transferase group 1 n=1 Tax=Opitutus terrae (strain DSM 11246 / JCM 15787 / PB90-1) TaxID=452637 RepID=B1ZV21_OPITP|nr:glycosyltransferase [Opitutus terrae]ACB75991.1 glycosyl transferase group 1 [Opitutus terrae PB90-1]
MKILLVQDFLRSGGTERQSVLLANAFAEAGHAVTLLTFRPAGPLAATISARVTHRTLQPFDTTLDWFAPRLLGTAARLAPDIVLCLGRMANCYAGALQRRLGPRTAVIATMRTGKSLPWLFRRSLRQVRAVVANSRDACDVLVQRYTVDPAGITVIHNSLVFPAHAAGAGDALPASRAALREQFGARPATFVLLCVAMFRPEKNQRELIEIAAGLPAEFDWQLWLAGDGPARADCEQLARAKNCLDRVRFPGFLRDPSALYAAADVAVHASASESLSNFLIEAQAHGLPAVAYAAQGIAECFVPGQTGWVIPRGERDAFRDALEQLARATPPARAARAAAARDFARNTFDPARQVAAYLELFSRLRG